MRIGVTPAIVLAAGRGSRFGHAHKLLADFHRVPVLIATLAAVHRATRGPIVLVLGRRPRALQRAIAAHAPPIPGLRVVWNTAWRSGMASSLQAGVRGLPGGTGRTLVVLGDMPLISPRLIRRSLALQARRRPGVLVTRPVHLGRPGHPSVIDGRLLPEIKTLTGDRGAQAIVEKLAPGRVAVFDAGVDCVRDVDTRIRLRSLRGGRSRRLR